MINLWRIVFGRLVERDSARTRADPTAAAVQRLLERGGERPLTWLFAHGHQPSPHQMHRVEAFFGSRAPLPDGWEGDLHFCFLKHMQMECIQCLGPASPSRAWRPGASAARANL